MTPRQGILTPMGVGGSGVESSSQNPGPLRVWIEELG